MLGDLEFHLAGYVPMVAGCLSGPLVAARSRAPLQILLPVVIAPLVLVGGGLALVAGLVSLYPSGPGGMIVVFDEAAILLLGLTVVAVAVVVVGGPYLALRWVRRRLRGEIRVAGGVACLWAGVAASAASYQMVLGQGDLYHDTDFAIGFVLVCPVSTMVAGAFSGRRHPRGPGALLAPQESDGVRDKRG